MKLSKLNTPNSQLVTATATRAPTTAATSASATRATGTAMPTTTATGSQGSSALTVYVTLLLLHILSQSMAVVNFYYIFDQELKCLQFFLSSCCFPKTIFHPLRCGTDNCFAFQRVGDGWDDDDDCCYQP